MKEFGNSVGRRYAKIDIEGRKIFDTPENIREWRRPEEWEHTFSVIARFDPQSEREIKERILDRIEEMESEFGISFLIASRDFVLHATIQNGLSEPENRGRENSIFQELEDNEALLRARGSLAGLPLEFKYLLLDKGNCLLTVPKIPDAIIEARKIISSAYAAKNLKPLPLENILHATLARMVGFSKGKEEALVRYKEWMVRLRHEISASPIPVRVDKIRFGRASELWTDAS